MKKISAIMIAILLIATIQIASATDNTINLCQKQINIGNSWGVCNPNNNTIAQGTFTYNTIGPAMVFIASATFPTDITGNEYSLIYYKDSDPEHILPSTKLVNVLAIGVSGGKTTTFSGNWNGGNIPASDDINLRGKIWVVKSSEINSDKTLKWSGYANNTIMPDYLFESDSIAQTPNDGLTVRNRMGGINYTYVPNSNIPAITKVLSCPLVGVSINTNALNFGDLYPGTVSNTVTRSLTITGGVYGSSCMDSINILVTGTNWIGIGNSMLKSQTSDSIDSGPFNNLDSEYPQIHSGTHNINFKVSIPENQPPDTYTQTITISGIY